MPLPLRDYQVTFTREEDIAKSAFAWRAAAGNENRADFNIVDFVEGVLAKKIKGKGPLHLELFDMQQGGEPAFVTFQPLTLHIDRQVWELAKMGDPECRFIVAHEVGHLILHDHHAKAFSNDGRVNIKFATQECSAEWQANTFASYFLLPDQIVLAHSDANDLARSCSVTRQLANDRRDAVLEARKPRPKVEGGFCIECGCFTSREKGATKCSCY